MSLPYIATATFLALPVFVSCSGSGSDNELSRAEPNSDDTPRIHTDERSEPTTGSGGDALERDGPALEDETGDNGTGGDSSERPDDSASGGADGEEEPSSTAPTLIHFDDFSSDTLENWVSELQSPESSHVAIINGQLDVDVSAGATIWFREKLAGDVLIEYEVTPVDNGGENDRISDLNQFWMATDPSSESPFTRNGQFAEYDELRLYYVGMGGNNNSTTRFRRYPGNGERPLLGEYRDAPYLLQANTTYEIAIRCSAGRTQFIVDGEVFFEYDDSEALTEGYFGLRTVRNHQRVDNFRVTSIGN